MFTVNPNLASFRFLRTSGKLPVDCGWLLDPVRFSRNDDLSWSDLMRGGLYHSHGSVYKGACNSHTSSQFNVLSSKVVDTACHTYGVLCGFNGLFVIDFDDCSSAKKFFSLPFFKDTFCVLSGSKRLPHFYFRSTSTTEYPAVMRFDNMRGKRLCDVQGMNTFVIGPGSIISDGVSKYEYTVHHDVPVLDVDYSEIISLLESHLPCCKTVKKTKQNFYTGDFYSEDPLTKSIYSTVSCDMILSDFGVAIHNNPGDTPFADSFNGRCLHRTGPLWFCHHIQEGGDVIKLFSKLRNISYSDAKIQLCCKYHLDSAFDEKNIPIMLRNNYEDLAYLLAERFIEFYHPYYLKDGLRLELWCYLDGIYHPHGDNLIGSFCNSLLGKWTSRDLQRDVLNHVCNKSVFSNHTFFNDPSFRPLRFVPVSNGLLDIFSRTLHPFDPKYIFFNKLPVKFDPSADCDNTIDFYHNVLESLKDVKLIQEMYGYCLLRDYRYSTSFMFFGPGSAGKSVAMNLLHSFLGYDNCSEVSLHRLQLNSFSGSDLYCKYANISDDIGSAKLEETQIFKELTGNAWLSCDRKFKNSISFRNHAKMIFSANRLPVSSDDSSGFYRRWVILSFDKQFVRRAEWEKYKKDGFLTDKHFILNSGISSSLQSESQLSGVLNWALEGLSRLISNDGFSNNSITSETRSSWRKRTSNAITFIDELLIRTLDLSDTMLFDDVYGEYLSFCSTSRIIPETERRFRGLLREENIIIKRVHRSNGYEYMCYGIGFKRV